jgi:PKD repeat protein
MNDKTAFSRTKTSGLLKPVLLWGILVFLLLPQLVSGGTSGTATITGNVIHPPVALFAANITTGYAPLPVKFTDLSTGTPVAWNWDFGDGTNSSDQHPTHIYTTPGTWTVTLNITDLIGISSAVVKTGAITTRAVTTPPGTPGNDIPVSFGDNGGSPDRFMQVAGNLPGYLLAPAMPPGFIPANPAGPPAGTPSTPSGALPSSQMSPGQVPEARRTAGNLLPPALLLLGMAGVIAALVITGIAPAIIFTRRGAPVVYLRSAGNFVILAKSGIGTTGASRIRGNIGVSPASGMAITGFGETMELTNRFSTSDQVTGKIYAAGYSAPAPAAMTEAVRDMETAYADAASQAPDVSDLGAGTIGGRTLSPGIYAWSSGVLLPIGTVLTLDAKGDQGAVWIFRIAGDLSMESGSQVFLVNGAKAENIFWQVAGPRGVTMGSDAHAEGSMLALNAISMGRGASLEGRALAQTTVTLDANTLSAPGTGALPKS